MKKKKVIKKDDISNEKENTGNNKELILRAILALILFVVLITSIVSLVALKQNLFIEPSQKKIPVIKENFEKTKLLSVKKFDNTVLYDDDTKQIILSTYEKDVHHYIIGQEGKLYNSPITISNEDYYDDSQKYGNYTIKHTTNAVGDDQYYYVNEKEKNTSDYYDYMFPIIFKNNSCHYFILENYIDENNDDDIERTEFYIFDIIHEELIELDSQISCLIEIEELYNSDETNTVNQEYIVTMNKDNKYGVIDYEGNTIIDYKYDYISTYKDEDTFIVRDVNGKYGIIDSDEDIEYELIYNDLEFDNREDNFLLARKGNKLGVYYKNKLIVDYTIDIYNKDNELIYYFTTKNDIMYLTIMPENEENYDSSNDSTMNYLITKKGIVRTLEGTLDTLYEYDDINNYDTFDYFYKLNKKDNNEIEVSFYDLDFYDYFMFNITIEDKYPDYEIFIYKLNNNNYYYKLEVLYNDKNGDETKKDNYYIDLFNSKLINEVDAIYNYFDNGYGYTLNSGTLKVYKEKKLLNTYENIDDYLGGYYFVKNNDNGESTIYNLEFIKESNN